MDGEMSKEGHLRSLLEFISFPPSLYICDD